MSKANFQNAHVLYASTTMDEPSWVAVFNAGPDIMWKILGDVFTVACEQQDRDQGIYKAGRRPMRRASSMEEFRRTVLPDHWNLEPFPIALRGLIGNRSQMQFAPRVPVSQPTLSRLLSGDIVPDLGMLERLAAAARVPPFFFVEYRAGFIGEMTERVLRAQPHLGITAMKAYLKGAQVE